jgi:hypothetical protein
VALREGVEVVVHLDHHRHPLRLQPWDGLDDRLHQRALKDDHVGVDHRGEHPAGDRVVVGVELVRDLHVVAFGGQHLGGPPEPVPPA